MAMGLSDMRPGTQSVPTMRVKILKETGGYQVGQVLDLPSEMVVEWLKTGYAKAEKKEQEVETAVMPAAPERAVTKQAKPVKHQVLSKKRGR